MLDLNQPGAYARTAGGNQEIPEIQKQAIAWIAWSLNADNGGGGGTAIWDKAVGLWNAAGLANFPWMHVRKMEDLQRLISVGEAKNAPAIGCNIEDLVGDKLSLQEIGGYLLDFWVNRYEKPVHMPTLDWLQNGQGWNYVSFCNVALEIFPGEGNLKNGYNATVVQQCIDHAFAEGCQTVTLLFKTKDLSPATYGQQWSICHSLYTSDDITPDQSAWAAWKQDGVCERLKGSDVFTPTQKKAFRDELVRYCLEAERYESRWHYSQNRPYTGLGTAPQTYHLNDCSSYCALAFWWAGHHTAAVAPDPLNYHYSGYGNTQSAYEYLRAHTAPQDKYRVGDMAIYGTSSRTVHMTVCRKAGTGATAVWSSFGREAGPEGRQPVTYHPAPLLGVYRHPALL